MSTLRALELKDDTIGSNETIVTGVFDLSASIDSSGLFTSGSLNISGTVPTLGFNSGTLLTGNLTAFGFSNFGGDPLEFLFDVTLITLRSSTSLRWRSSALS